MRLVAVNSPASFFNVTDIPAHEYYGKKSEECIDVAKNTPPCATVEVVDEQDNIRTSCNTKPKPTPPKQEVCLRCINLLQNPSFETGLSGWETDNVITTDGNPFEGTQAASLRQGVASIYQDVSLAGTGSLPLFLSFNVFPGANENDNGNLVAEVLWLDENRNKIATGLRLFIPEGRIEPDSSRLTYFDVTDFPPHGAAWARLQFSKGMGENADIIEIDQVILTPAGSANLVQNPGFELGVAFWNVNNFNPVFGGVFEGAAAVFTSENNSTLSQDIPITALPANSSFLFSFAVRGFELAALSVQLFWLDAEDAVIGTGLDLSIPRDTLEDQGNYLTYLDITSPAPAGAVKARVLFTSALIGETSLRIDKVILARVSTPNLVQNPSFENGFNNWTPSNITLITNNEAYEGTNAARFADNGGALFQDVPITNANGRCFLLNFGLGFRRMDTTVFSGYMLVQVYWLDNSNREIGLGLSLVIPGFAPERNQWLVYTGITEPAPRGAVSARVQFTKSAGSTGSVLDVDNVVFGRLIRCKT